MFYNDIIFQVKVNKSHLWGKFILNILDYGIYQYINNDTNMESYIKHWFNLVYSNLNKIDTPLESEVQIVLTQEKIPNIDKLYFDIEINQESKLVKILDFNLDSENYKNYYNKINSQLNIDLDTDYDSDELEYVIDDEYVQNKVEEEFPKYLTKEFVVRKKFKDEVKKLEEKYGDCLEGALYQMYKEQYFEKFNYMKEEKFIKSKLENSDKKLKILEYLIENFYSVNSSLHKYCLNKYATQLFRKFKYQNDNLTKIKYNFVVTSFEVEKKYQHSEIKIDFKSLTSDVTGQGSFIEGGNNKSGTYTKIYCDIDKGDIDSKLEKELIDYVTYEMSYIKK